ncbi:MULTISPECIES: hypothetical protein [unclassified Streptomyces]|uniref:hypothetical protein n=1 Tax=unclassified Streptomyces TaxID=2593676 RepID=UPI003793A80E
MADQQPPPPAPWGRPPGASWAYAPPRAPEIDEGYRRRARIFTRLAIVLGSLLASAFAASVVLLVQADKSVDNAAYGYLALFLWGGIFLAIPLLLAFAIPAVVMNRRVRQQRRAWTTPA